MVPLPPSAAAGDTGRAQAEKPRRFRGPKPKDPELLAAWESGEVEQGTPEWKLMVDQSGKRAKARYYERSKEKKGEFHNKLKQRLELETRKNRNNLKIIETLHRLLAISKSECTEDCKAQRQARLGDDDLSGGPSFIRPDGLMKQVFLDSFPGLVDGTFYDVGFENDGRTMYLVNQEKAPHTSLLDQLQSDFAGLVVKKNVIQSSWRTSLVNLEHITNTKYFSSSQIPPDFDWGEDIPGSTVKKSKTLFQTSEVHWDHLKAHWAALPELGTGPQKDKLDGLKRSLTEHHFTCYNKDSDRCEWHPPAPQLKHIADSLMVAMTNEGLDSVAKYMDAVLFFQWCWLHGCVPGDFEDQGGICPKFQLHGMMEAPNPDDLTIADFEARKGFGEEILHTQLRGGPVYVCLMAPSGRGIRFVMRQGDAYLLSGRVREGGVISGVMPTDEHQVPTAQHDHKCSSCRVGLTIRFGLLNKDKNAKLRKIVTDFLINKKKNNT